jgi:hypothetical protein
MGPNALAIAALARAGCFAELTGVDHEMREVDESAVFSPAVLEAVATFFKRAQGSAWAPVRPPAPLDPIPQTKP